MLPPLGDSGGQGERAGLRQHAPLEASEEQAFSGAPSFALSHRLYRALWKLVWTLLARWTPPQMRLWRIFLLRAFGAEVDWRASVYSSASVWYPRNLKMDRNACLGPRVNCYAMARIELGRNTVISQGAHLCAGTHDFDTATFQLMVRPILIGADVWVAAEAFVGPGVVIEDGAVLGARAVATRRLDAWSVYAGNPARFLRPRRWKRDDGIV